MKKTKLLSSTLVMAMVSVGAYAADEMITGGAGTCTADVLKVSDNNATANTIAVWTMNEYTLNPGQYLNVTETDVAAATCPAGSYCVGGTGFTVDNASTSIEQCPTEYPNSAAGAGAQNQCYTACTVATANIAHATAVGGNDYFGDGLDACYATACATGYHVKPGLNLTDTIGTTDAGTGYTSNDNNGNEISSDNLTSSDAGIAGDPVAFAVAYGDKGMITGHGRCSTQAGVGIWDSASTPEDITVVNTLADETGQEGAQYCYCQLDGYKSASGEITPITSAPWVFSYDFGSADVCASYCADYCANVLQYGGVDNLAFRAVVFGSLGALPATCAANTINIDWNPDNGGVHIQNMCTYNDAITLPAEPTKPGYTFTGWKLDTTAKTE